MENQIITSFSPGVLVVAVIVASVYIILFSLVKEPYRQTVNALLIAGASATYLSGGFGVGEFLICPPMLYLAYKGLSDYRYIGFGWLLHTVWDLAHHFYGHPILPFDASSSMGCAVCDPLLALWFFLKAPSVFDLFAHNTPSLRT